MTQIATSSRNMFWKTCINYIRGTRYAGENMRRWNEKVQLVEYICRNCQSFSERDLPRWLRHALSTCKTIMAIRKYQRKDASYPRSWFLPRPRARFLRNVGFYDSQRGNSKGLGIAEIRRETRDLSWTFIHNRALSSRESSKRKFTLRRFITLLSCHFSFRFVLRYFFFVW